MTQGDAMGNEHTDQGEAMPDEVGPDEPGAVDEQQPANDRNAGDGEATLEVDDVVGEAPSTDS